MLSNVQLTLIWKQGRYFPPSFPSRGTNSACRQAGAHPECPCGSLIHCCDHAQGPPWCRAPGWLCLSRLRIWEHSRSARAASSLEHPTVGTEPCCCQEPGWGCCTSPPCAAQTQDRDPHPVPVTFSKPSILPSLSSGKSPRVRGDSSISPVVLALKANWFLYF